ncbi:MAG: hypothetical protein LBD86_07550 [Spirochaetaceae bacterium]|jgi:hypothetical protein|nr:hypothetical protein [Spirochaetaceae bacterium]
MKNRNGIVNLRFFAAGKIAGGITAGGIIAAGSLAALTLTALSCEKLDVVGSGSAASFEKVLNQIPQSVTEDRQAGGWSLSAPDGGARFIWSGDFSQSPLFDAAIEFDAAPFLAAGLDPAKLPENFTFSGGKLTVGTKLGTETLKYRGEASPLDSYKWIVRLRRDVIGYHAALDHYGVSLGGGNIFEWAKDMGANDKDIVFVLDPAPFAAAGANPSRIDGWLFAKVSVDDENGKPVQVDKLLKPFDLK